MVSLVMWAVIVNILTMTVHTANIMVLHEIHIVCILVGLNLIIILIDIAHGGA